MIPRTCPDCDEKVVHNEATDSVTCTGCGWVRTAARFAARWLERQRAQARGKRFKARV